jgi:hypothetical protein
MPEIALILMHPLIAFPSSVHAQILNFFLEVKQT